MKRAVLSGIIAVGLLASVGEARMIYVNGETGNDDWDGLCQVWDGDGDAEACVHMGVDEYGSYVFEDLNCDAGLDAFDVDPFVLALTDVVGYAQQYPDCDRMLGDIDADGECDRGRRTLDAGPLATTSNEAVG